MYLASASKRICFCVIVGQGVNGHKVSGSTFHLV